MKFSKSVYRHADKPGAGAKKRRRLKGGARVHAVMGEFKRERLRSGSGQKVTKHAQAVRIGMEEARRASRRRR
jgi:hypothetical protein